MRTERAKQMLSETDLPIATIADEMGFTGIEKFSAVFRRICRTTPTQYRRACRGTGHLPKS